jgi:hypothetical protein
MDDAPHWTLPRQYLSSPWTEEALARLTALVQEGRLTRAEIAAVFGVTKNAIAGAIWRLGLYEPRPATPRGPRIRIRIRKPKPKAA